MALPVASTLLRMCHLSRSPRMIMKIRTLSSSHNLQSYSRYETDPAPLFFSPEVQELIKKLNKTDIKKVNRHRKTGEKLQAPEYKFMTSEEIEKCVAEIRENTENRLQPPPIVLEEPEINEILANDKEMSGFDEAKYVVTDITYGCKDKDRLIVVREPDGVLRKAHWAEKRRMNQIYFPHPERQIRMPHMFEDTYLKNLLEKEEYEYVLDRACIQFEPYESDYHRVTSTVYDRVEELKKFDLLLSTRHYGSFVFYLTWHKRIDNLLLHYIETNRIEDAVLLLKLFHVLHPDVKSAETHHEDPINIIQDYIKDSNKKSLLELALATHLELQKHQQMVKEGIKKAHGL